MPTELANLLRRDHLDLQAELTRLLDPALPLDELKVALDGVRLGLVAHAEAADIVLGGLDDPDLEALVVESGGAHVAQERALTTLVSLPPGTDAWRDRAHHLRELVRVHADHEERRLIPALARDPAYARLAGAFATQRLRQLAMLQPSQPVSIAQLAI